MMGGRNLGRITIKEYLLKLNKNPYPMLDVHDESINPTDKIAELKIRRHDAPAPFDLNLYQKIAILDHFNSEFVHCELCLLPYSYKQVWHVDKQINVCIFCFILHQKYPPTIYAQDDEPASISIEQKTVEISPKFFSQALTDHDEIMETIRNEIDHGSKETSLDQFF